MQTQLHLLKLDRTGWYIPTLGRVTEGMRSPHVPPRGFKISQRRNHVPLGSFSLIDLLLNLPKEACGRAYLLGEHHKPSCLVPSSVLSLLQHGSPHRGPASGTGTN